MKKNISFLSVASLLLFASAVDAKPPVGGGGGSSPTPPSNLSAIAVSTSQIDLSWQDNSGNETGFKVERSTDGFSFNEIADVGENVAAYSDTGLNENTTYYYRVRAYKIQGNTKYSGYSNTANAATLENPPAAPDNFVATPGIEMSTSSPHRYIDLMWNDNSDNEDLFVLEKSADGTNFSFYLYLPSNTTNYRDAFVLINTTYYYRIKASNGGGDSAYSNIASATTFDLEPIAPSSLIATAYSSSQIGLSWQDNSDNEGGFRIERSPDGSNFTEIAQVTANTVSYSDSGLDANTTYYYRVYAYNNGGASQFSNTANATTLENLPAAPSNLTAVPVWYGASSTDIYLAWQDNSDNESGFVIEKSTDGVNFYYLVSMLPNSPAFADSSIFSGVTYYYRVKAFNGGGDSSYSNIASATAL